MAPSRDLQYNKKVLYTENSIKIHIEYCYYINTNFKNIFSRDKASVNNIKEIQKWINKILLLSYDDFNDL